MCIIADANLAGAFTGERIFLIGNGPSLAETPLDLLDGEYTMAMNKIDLIYDTVAWRPDFYVCTHRMGNSSDLRRSIQIHDDINSTHLFLDADLRGTSIAPVADVTFVNVNYMQDFRQENPMNTDTRTVRAADISWLEQYWSFDIPKLVWAFHSMYVAAQLAVWMGFDEIYFIGTDLGFTDPIHMPIQNGIDPMRYKGNKLRYLKTAVEEGKMFSALINGVTLKLLLYLRSIGGINRVLSPDGDYFTPSYGKRNIYHDLNGEFERSHVVIRRICESAGVRVRNATLGGELEVYPRVNFIEVL